MSSLPPRGYIVALLACSLMAVGCGPIMYAANIGPAARTVERAREAGAAETAPYEFYYAEAHLHKAREDAGEAAYQDATAYAETAEEFAARALEIGRESNR